MNEFPSRIKALSKAIGPDSVAIISSNPIHRKSNDTVFPHHPNTDLRYLTGTTAQDISLIVLGGGAGKSIILSKKPDPLKALWDGEGEKPEIIAKRTKSTLIRSHDLAKEALSFTRGFDALFYQPLPTTLSFQIAQGLFGKLLYERRGQPKKLVLLDVALSPLRLKKSDAELHAIRKAIAVTKLAFDETLPCIQPGVTESFVAATLEYWMKTHGGEPAFRSIVGSGKSASVLHYQPKEKVLKEGEMLLIDFGAAVDGYCADVTRVVPVGSTISPEQLDLYHIVQESCEAAIETARAGVQVKAVQDAAASILIKGLQILKILPRGSVAKQLASGEYKKYFPHSIGHSLGLDVHDVGEVRGIEEAVLLDRMVMTIEPGLYFQKPTGKLPACGVRIEHDIFVQKRGSSVLTRGIQSPFEW